MAHDWARNFRQNAVAEWFDRPHPELSAPIQQSEKGSIPQTQTSDGDSVLGGLLDLSLETHGTDWEEEQFRRRMQRKKRKHVNSKNRKIMSQQEDDLRALAKIMDFLRAVSIILVVAHLYWYCYEAIKLWGLNIGVVDRILMNFHRTAGLFGNMLYTKLFALVLMGLSCLGTKGVKEEHITWSKIWAFMGAGFVFFFLNWWILALPLPIEANAALYTFTITVGYVCLLMAGLYMSRLLKNNLMEDVFNQENESFMQETRLFGKRVLGQSTDPVLLSQEMEQGLDKRGQSFPSCLRLGNAGQR